MNIFFIALSAIAILVNPLQAQRIYSKTILEFNELYPETKWIKCTKNYKFDYKPFPLSYIYPHIYPLQYPVQGMFRDVSILEVKNAVGFLRRRLPTHPNVFCFYVNNISLKERQVNVLDPLYGQDFLDIPDLENIEKINGRVAVVNHVVPYAYGHFLLDVLSHLALLEIYNVDYDYLWIPYESDFIKEILDVWGIDRSKIISAKLDKPIFADILIVPTAVGQHNLPMGGFGNYYHDFLLRHIRIKLLEAAKRLGIMKQDYPKKIFISRSDSILNVRKILNEEEVFSLFEPLGYKKLVLTNLSIIEKILIFNNATHIIGVNGAGATHIIFAEAGTYYFEMQHIMIEPTFCFISQMMGLNYVLLDLSTEDDLINGGPMSHGKMVNLNLVKEFIAQHLEL